MDKRSPRLPRRIVLSFLIAAATLAALEGGARVALMVLGPGPAPIQVAWAHGDDPRREALRDLMFTPDPALFFRLMPHLALDSSPSNGVFDLHTDERGHRVPPTRPPSDGARRMLCVGDSCTFGWGAAGEDTFPAQVAGRMPGWEVLNVGVPGYSSFQGRRYLELEGWALAPDVVTFNFGFNDACAAARGGTKRNMPKGESLSDAAYAARLRKPSPIGLVRLVQRLRKGDAGSLPRKGKGKARGERAATPRVSAGEYRANLEAVADECAARGARLILIVWPLKNIPGKNDVEETGRLKRCREYQEIVREVAAERGVDLIDLVPIVEETRGLFVDRVHFNDRGYAIVADEVASILQAPSE